MAVFIDDRYGQEAMFDKKAKYVANGRIRRTDTNTFSMTSRTRTAGFSAAVSTGSTVSTVSSSTGNESFFMSSVIFFSPF